MKTLKTTIALLYVLLLSTLAAYAQENQFLPQANFKGELVNHGNYHLYYIEQHEQAAWVAYELDVSDAFSKRERTDNFREDASISTGSATLEDYKGSGYDRGHQIPAGDAKGSYKDMSTTFLLSNMVVQSPNFNRVSMRNLEMLIRDLTGEEKKLYVVTGPVFKDTKGSIGSNKVTIPGYFYKAILDLTPPYKMIGFLLPHEDGLDQDMSNYTISIDELEEVTGINFFPQLEDTMENELEANTNFSDWNISNRQSSKSYKYVSNSSSSSNQEKQSYLQCNGIAKSTGKRCKIKVSSTDGFCRYHISQKK